MANLNVDSPLSRLIVRSFLQFLNSVSLHSGVDAEALDVAKDCLSEVFNIDKNSLDDPSGSDSLVRIFSSLGAVTDNATDKVTFTDQTSPSLGEEVLAASRTSDADMGKEMHSLGQTEAFVSDELFGTFFSALERLNYFRRLPDGSDDQNQLDVATKLFHIAIKEMETSGCRTFDQKTLAETFKSQGNKAMQSKVYSEAVDLYTFAIALSENNAVYYCNRAAAYTQVQDYTRAVQDCLKSIQINPNYSKAYSRLGFAYYAQGRYREAIDNGFRKALQLDPGNESVKENIRVAEQKLKEEQQRNRSFQFETPFVSVPVTGRSSSIDLNTIFTNMAGGNAFQGEAFENRNHGTAREDGARNDPGTTRVSGNASINTDAAGISDALRSMMGMFTEAPGNQQQNDSTQR